MRKNTRVQITFPFTPRTKQSVRFSKRKGAWQPKSVTEFEAAVKAKCQEVMEQRGIKQFTQPVKVHIKLMKDKFVVTITEIGSYKPTVPGDVDNYSKGILDGLQGAGGIIGNDRQVQELNVTKKGEPR